MGVAATTWVPMGAQVAAVSSNDHPNPSEGRQEGFGKSRIFENSIAFSSAPRREAVSQLDRPAVSQTETHTLGFFLTADTRPSSGENNCLRTGSGRMVMQATAGYMVGGLNPGAASMAATGADAGTHQDLNRRPKNLRLGALPFDRGRM